jgi:drug/metabolite transporter (DMT)-like permease
MSISPRQLVLLFLLSAVWGSSFLLIRYGLEGLSPYVIVFGHTVVAAVLLGLMLRLTRGSLGSVSNAIRDLRARPLIALTMSALLMTGFLLTPIGQQHVDSGLAAVIVSAEPILVAILAIFVDQSERVRGWRVLGLLLGLSGVGFVVGVEAVGSINEFFGAIAVLSASVMFSSYYLFTKGRYSRLQPLETTFICFIVGSVLTLPFALATIPAQTPSTRSILAVVAMGFLPVAGGFALSNILVKEIGAGRMALSAYLVPALALAYGAVLVSEPVTIIKVLGLVLILSGVALAARRGEAATKQDRDRERATISIT